MADDMQEVSATSHGATHSSDLAILSTAASQLFESTAGMSTRACCDVLIALQQVSLNVKDSPAAQTPGNPRYSPFSYLDLPCTLAWSLGLDTRGVPLPDSRDITVSTPLSSPVK